MIVDCHFKQKLIIVHLSGCFYFVCYNCTVTYFPLFSLPLLSFRLSSLSPFPSLSLYIDQGSATNLGYHTINGGMTPTVSMEQVNPVRDMGGCPPSPVSNVNMYTIYIMCAL